MNTKIALKNCAGEMKKMDWKGYMIGAAFVALGLATLGYNVLGSWGKWVIGLGLVGFGVTYFGLLKK